MSEFPEYRVVAPAGSTSVLPVDWLLDGASIAGDAASGLRLSAADGIAVHARCPLGDGGDVLRRAVVDIGRLESCGEVAVHLNRRCALRACEGGAAELNPLSLRKCQPGGFRIAWSGAGHLRIETSRGLLAERALAAGETQGRHTIELVTLADRFLLRIDEAPPFTGVLPDAQNNEGSLAVLLRDAAVTLLGTETAPVARNVPCPAWRRTERLYSEPFTPESLARGWVTVGQEPVAADRAFLFRHMGNSFLRTPFDGPVAFDFDATPQPAPGFSAGVTDAIFIWMASSPGRPLPEHLASLPDASLAHLHPLSLYWVDMGGTNNATTRLRRNPGRRLVRQFTEPARLLQRGRTYRFTVAQHGHFVEFHVDGEPWVRTWDPEPHTAGHVGFRAFVSDLAVSKLEVWRVQ